MLSTNFSNEFLYIYVCVVIGIIGLVIGSFLNVVALRLMSEESIVFPRSKCPKCQTPINWYDNIPVISYLLLGGKCRNCKEHISIQYPIVEIATSALFVIMFLVFGLTLKTLCLIILGCALVVITITDLKEQLIYDIISVPIIPLGLIYNFFNIGHTGGLTRIPLHGIGHTLVLNEAFVSAIIGAILGAAFFELTSRLGLLLVGEYAFGGGDSIIAAGLGAWFGWQFTIVILVLSFLFQVIIGIPILLYNMHKDKDYKSLTAMGVLLFSVLLPRIGTVLGFTKHIIGALLVMFTSIISALAGVFVILQRAKERQSFTFIPFGPALVLGGFAVMFWGQQIIDWSIKLNLHR